MGLPLRKTRWAETALTLASHLLMTSPSVLTGVTSNALHLHAEMLVVHVYATCNSSYTSRQNLCGTNLKTQSCSVYNVKSFPKSLHGRKRWVSQVTSSRIIWTANPEMNNSGAGGAAAGEADAGGAAASASTWCVLSQARPTHTHIHN